MPIPTECKMPDLSNLESPLMNRLIVRLAVGEKNISPNAANYRRNFIRLIDKAIREYSEARMAMIAQIEESKRPAKGTIELYILGFTNHMENCINAVSRLFRLLNAIISEKQSPKLPRTLKKLIQTQNESVKNIRNSIEHIEGDIQKGVIPPGHPVMLSINENNDCIVVSNHEIAFKDLAMILRNINEIALYLLEIKSCSEI